MFDLQIGSGLLAFMLFEIVMIYIVIIAINRLDSQ